MDLGHLEGCREVVAHLDTLMQERLVHPLLEEGGREEMAVRGTSNLLGIRGSSGRQ